MSFEDFSGTSTGKILLFRLFSSWVQKAKVAYIFVFGKKVACVWVLKEG